MEPTRLEDWEMWQRQGCTRVPATMVVRAEVLPASWEPFFRGNPAAVLLESGQSGRYTFLCDRAARVITGDAASAVIRRGGDLCVLEEIEGVPVEIIARALAGTKTPALTHWPAMVGGVIGVFGYDLVRTWERLPVSAKRDLDVPVYAMIEPNDLFVFDAVTGVLGILCWCDLDPKRELLEQFTATATRAEGASARWTHARQTASSGGVPLNASTPAAPAPSFTAGAFRSAVLRAQEYIAAGDTYQVNLSLRTSKSISIEAETIYQALKRVNPSPYMGLLKLPEFSLVCGSPELLVRMVDGLVSSRPIAGTRPRGAAQMEDSNYSAELLASEKERAEHLMLVDLIRNDIGRIAAYGSVSVREFMVLERYSHVMHIVSQVEGRLAPGKTWRDVLRSMFPGGTITGCPKIRTMEIIEELEPVGRAFYTGAMGWISYRGDMELNIVIRSMLVQNGIGHVQAGAGVVADSQPDRELDEALRKAQALWVALDHATAAKS